MSNSPLPPAPGFPNVITNSCYTMTRMNAKAAARLLRGCCAAC
jgi:hypothetical protein